MTTPSFKTTGALRVALDLMLGLGIIAAIPLTVLGVHDRSWGVNTEGIRPRLAEVERLRPLTVPVDRTISPEAAGAAMRRMLPLAATPAFPLPAEYFRTEPWKAPQLGDVLSIMRTGEWNGPEPTMIIYAAGGAQGVENVLQEPGRAWLKTVASSHIWKDFDMVARAPRVDMLAQRFQVPFGDDAWPGPMPIPSFEQSRILAFAGVSRAAYYLSLGDTVRAEATLRTVLSFGFAMLDDGITTVEGLMGRAVIDAARDGLSQLYRLDYRRMDEWNLVDPFASRVSTLGFRQAVGSVATLQAAALRNVADAKLPRSFRFDQLGMLALSTCGTVRSVVLGPSAEVQQAFDEARRSLAQSEAERQYVDLLEHNISAVPVRPVPRSVLLQVVQGAAVVTSTVTGNSRTAGCTRAVIGDFL